MTRNADGRVARKVIAMTWEQHRRTQGLCGGLGIVLFELSYRGGRIARYVVLVCRTIALIARERPQVLLVQNPSLVLALLALLLRPVARYRLVVDAHNEAVQPFINTYWPIPQLAHLLLARAHITIVSNQKLARAVERAGGRPFVLPDCLPSAPVATDPGPDIGKQFDVMVVATYAPDEPISEILAAAARLGSAFSFQVTGNERKLSAAERAKVPCNVRLTGYLPEHDYWILMGRCHAVMDLTLMPDCLVCGAYEALAMCKPMVLSDNAASRELFGTVAIFSLPDSAEIEEALHEARRRYHDLIRAAPPARDAYQSIWERDSARLLVSLHENEFS